MTATEIRQTRKLKGIRLQEHCNNINFNPHYACIIERYADEYFRKSAEAFQTKENK